MQKKQQNFDFLYKKNNTFIIGRFSDSGLTDLFIMIDQIINLLELNKRQISFETPCITGVVLLFS